MKEKISKKFLLLLTFFVGFSSLATEILVIRALSFIIGTNMIVTSIIIAAVIISLSFGYYLSLKVKEEDQVSAIFKGITITGIYLCFSPTILELVKISKGLGLNQSYLVDLLISSIWGILLLAIPPSISIGFSSPLIFSNLKNYYKRVEEVASKSFTLSGIGSLFGSVLPNLVLIPIMGLSKTFIFLGVIHLIISGIIFGKNRKMILKSIFMSSLILILSTVSHFANKKTDKSVKAQFETPYQTIFVIEEEYGEKNLRYLSFNSRFGIQSIHDPEGKFFEEFYYDEFLIFMNKNLDSNGNSEKENFDVLVLGSAGGTISSYISKFYGDVYDNLQITNVDIDPKVHEIAKNYFDAENQHTKFVTADARVFVDRNSEEKFDLIIIDAYSNEFFVPDQMITTEFFNSVKNNLTSGGIVALNINSTDKNSDLVEFLSGSLQQNFDYTYISNTEPDGKKDISNFVVSASDLEINFDQLSEKSADPNLKSEHKFLAKKTSVLDKSDEFLTDNNVSGEILSIKLILELV